mmetsp:Transcript_85819/g.157254  ORF Transcript_85819/g.157254 Transcript_85819/m.157254 type:complete len:81 (+) Transcript_85819:775-1017(+)
MDVSKTVRSKLFVDGVMTDTFLWIGGLRISSYGLPVHACANMYALKRIVSSSKPAFSIQANRLPYLTPAEKTAWERMTPW